MRVLPHHQNTGGFFIALLRKKEWLPWQNKCKRKAAASSSVTSTARTADSDSQNSLTTVDLETQKTTRTVDSTATRTETQGNGATTTTTTTTTESTNEDSRGLPADMSDVVQDASASPGQETLLVGHEPSEAGQGSGAGGEGHGAVGGGLKEEEDERPSASVLGRSVGATVRKYSWYG